MAYSMSPAREWTQRGLAPVAGTDILYSWKPAGQHAGEILDAPPHAIRQPRRILMAQVLHPTRLRPLLRSSRQGWHGRPVPAQDRQRLKSQEYRVYWKEEHDAVMALLLMRAKVLVGDPHLVAVRITVRRKA